MAGSIRANIKKKFADDPDRARNTFCYFGNDSNRIKDQLEMFNSATGYAFLLDRAGRIRWQVHGHINAEEEKTLCRCVSELLASSR